MVIPLWDLNRRRTFPVVTVTLIAVNLAFFLYQLNLGLDTQAGIDFVNLYGTIPSLILSEENLNALISSMFLHGGWMHLLGNMFFLWVFGDNIEDFLGPVRYILFYLLTGVAASLSYILFSGSYPYMPMLGASGAISGVMGAYIYLFPSAPIITLIPLGCFANLIPLPAWLYLIIWFGSQFLIASSTGVAVQAHIGGFLAGILLVVLFAWGKRPMTPGPRWNPPRQSLPPVDPGSGT
ncbi:MAG: rhomboid family intramembrane serine protease [Coprothermobacterota bacterium]|nr:rhomboid family intramembrane serine protease [Coprothermobacterota bacterium]